MEFTIIPASHLHPVCRYGYDPIPGNKGRYYWDEERQEYLPGDKSDG